MNKSSNAILSSAQVGEFMISLGVQDNVNLQQQPTVPPGAFAVGSFNDGASVVTHDVSTIPPDLPIVARLAPNEAEVRARITERVQHEMNQRIHERMTQTVVISDDIIVADEVKDEPIRKTFKLSTRIMVSLVFLVVGFGLGGIVYWLMPNDEAPKRLQKGDPVAPSPAPTEASSFRFDSLDPLVEELKPFIAPTEEDLIPFMDSTSPQSQALVWLQDDPITMTPGRSIRTALERYVMAVLYYTTNGPSWNNHQLNRNDVCTWNEQISDDIPDTWTGVACSVSGGTIDSLSLWRNNLVGPVPWELVLLTDLKSIIFNDNRLSGSIPTRISELSTLETFVLRSNKLEGGLPATISPVTSVLDLSYNLLSGSLPDSWWASMPALQKITLNVNKITGSIPTSIGQLQNMLSFQAALNQLTGTLPTELGLLTLLETLILESNYMTGSVPPELDQLSSLDELDIAWNSFFGSLNETVCGLSGLSFLRADCGEVDCPCCTVCCDGARVEPCQEMTR